MASSSHVLLNSPYRVEVAANRDSEVVGVLYSRAVCYFPLLGSVFGFRMLKSSQKGTGTHLVAASPLFTTKATLGPWSCFPPETRFFAVLGMFMIFSFLSRVCTIVWMWGIAGAGGHNTAVNSERSFLQQVVTSEAGQLNTLYRPAFSLSFFRF